MVSELKRVFSLIRHKEYDLAETQLESLGSLAPGYFEVERVKAYLKFETGDFVAARHAYEIALELRPDYAPLHYWYGGFLLRAYDDLDGALEGFDREFKLQPSVLVRREHARVLLYKGMFEQAEEIIDELLATESLSTRHMAILSDLKIQVYCRNFEHQIDAGELQRAVELLVAARRFGGKIPDHIFDERMADKYRKILSTIEALSLRLEGTTNEGLLQELLVWATDFADRGVQAGRLNRLGQTRHGVDDSFESNLELVEEDTYQQLVEGTVSTGLIARIADTGTFGFIRTHCGQDLFFHQSSVVSRKQRILMAPRAKVDFTVGRNNKGFCAKEVQFRFGGSLDELHQKGEPITAWVVYRREGINFGYGIIPDYGELAIRKEDFFRPDEWLTLSEGDQVYLTVGKSERGFFGTRISVVTH